VPRVFSPEREDGKNGSEDDAIHRKTIDQYQHIYNILQNAIAFAVLKKLLDRVSCNEGYKQICRKITYTS